MSNNEQQSNESKQGDTGSNPLEDIENILRFEITEELSGQRLDKGLSKLCADLSRTRLQRLITEGQVTLNGQKISNASQRLEAGDVAELIIPAPVPCTPKPEHIELDVIFEDESLLVINKPAGLVVHPGAGNWDGTLVNALLHHCGNSLSGIGGVIRPGIVHRLDKDTSGLVIVAKTDEAHKFLAAQLADRSLSRKYLALVLGVPQPIKGTIDRDIGRDRHNRLRMSVTGNSPRDARTHYLVLKKFGNALSLVECSLETGRTHQIRVHMQAIGHPLIGDPQYGGQQTAIIAKMKKEGYSDNIIDMAVKFPRQALHAAKISFIHPVTKKTISFETPPPPDLSNLLEKLENS